MSTQATRCETTPALEVLYMSLELGDREWKVLFGTSGGRRRERTVPARQVGQLMEEMAAAKAKLKLPGDARVVSCYEAGRDGFWLDRVLQLHGIESLVIDSASIEVSRRARRPKSDRLDLAKLMVLLLRWAGGERDALHIVRVPDVDSEDIRQLSRAIARLKSEQGQHRVRLKSLLIKEGIKVVRVGGRDWARQVAELRSLEGRPLGRWLQVELVLQGERLAQVEAQLALLQKERDAYVKRGETPTARAAQNLMRLGAIGRESAFVFATEVLGWRTFANRKELAGIVGLVPTPFKSGGIDREQGVSKSGNRRMRTMLVEIAWCWLRYQPSSALSRWWNARFAKGGERARKVGIVALARKLLVALWRYLGKGIVPEGAVLKGPRVQVAA